MLRAIRTHLVHPHTGAPIVPVGYRRNGLPIWPILGASDDDGDKSDDDPDDDGGDKSDDDPDDDDGDKADDDLKPEDKPDTVEYWKKRARQNEREARRAKRELDKAKQGTPGKKDDGKDEPTAEEIRAQARAEVEAEVLADRLKDKIEAKASKFAKPRQAVALILDEHDPDDFLDDGKIDVEAIVEALDDLLKENPNLAAQGGKRFGGGGDGGAKPDKTERPKSLGEALKRHYDK